MQADTGKEAGRSKDCADSELRENETFLLLLFSLSSLAVLPPLQELSSSTERMCDKSHKPDTGSPDDHNGLDIASNDVEGKAAPPVWAIQ